MCNEVLTFTEHKVGGDVERLDLDVVHGHGDALLVVAGDEREGLLGLAQEGAAGRGHQGRQVAGGGRVLPSWRSSISQEVCETGLTP